MSGIAKRLEDIDNTQKKAGAETLRTVETRLDNVAQHLRSNEELALEARRAVEEAMASVAANISTNESRGRNSIQALHTTLTKLAERMARVERAAKAAIQPAGFATPLGLGNGYPPPQVGFPIPNFDAPAMGGSFGMPAPREPDFPMTAPLAVPVAPPHVEPAPAPAAPESSDFEDHLNSIDEAIDELPPPPFADEDVVPQLSTQEAYVENFDANIGEDEEPEPELLTPAHPQTAQARAAEDFLAAARRAAQAAAHGHAANPHGGFASGFGAGMGSAAARYRAEDAASGSNRKWLMGGAIALFCIAAIFGIVRLLNERPPADTAPVVSENAPENTTDENSQVAATTPTAPIILTPKTLAPEPSELDPAQLEAVEPENQVAPVPTEKPKTARSKPTATPAGTATLTPAPSATPAPSTPVTTTPLSETQQASGLQNAAQNGNADAQYMLAQQYASGEGLPQDMAKAAEWYEKAAKQNLATAQYRLATLYEKGKGVTQNDKLARDWYEKAAAQGNVKAMHNLAVIHAEGRGVKQNFATAARWFGQAAEYGLGDSQYNLAILNERGLGIPQELAVAYKWFSIAATGGDKGAAQKRDELAGKLDAATLAQAKLSVENWSARMPDAKANGDIGIGPSQAHAGGVGNS